MVKSYFSVSHRDPDCGARAGVLQTPHGEIQTPVFMPVGTNATVKTVTAAELKTAGAQIILSNAYHLYLRPGVDGIEALGGLHAFMGWHGPILTDSGGYQIFSLNEAKEIRKEGLRFKSHLDGSWHFLTPEDVIRSEERLGVDIIMPLDECVPHPVDKQRARDAVHLTQDWLVRSKKTWLSVKQRDSLLFGIIQGSVYEDLRRESAEAVASLDLPGIAIGGLSVGEPQDIMVQMLEAILPVLPDEKPRYLMGVGYPEDLFLAVERGVDMFDCVVPTRNGRNGTVFYSEGKMILRNAEFARDSRPIDENCPCYTCQNHSRAYLRHLFQAKEMLGLRLASLHNLTFFIQLLNSMRAAIQDGRFVNFKNEFLKQHTRGKTACMI